MRPLPLIAAAAIVLGASAASAAHYRGHTYGYDAYGYDAYGPYGAYATTRQHPDCRLARHESGAEAIQDRFYLVSQGVSC
jgi:hypothetical protein